MRFDKTKAVIRVRSFLQTVSWKRVGVFSTVFAIVASLTLALALREPPKNSGVAESTLISREAGQPLARRAPLALMSTAGSPGQLIPTPPQDGGPFVPQSTNGFIGWDATIPTTLPPSGVAGGCLTGTYPNPSIDGSCIPAPTVLWNGDSGGAQGGVVYIDDAGVLHATPWYSNQAGQFATLGNAGTITLNGLNVTEFTSTTGTPYIPTFTGYALGCGCGGGGGGGGGSTKTGGSGGGGGGALWSCKLFPTTAYAALTITAGTGGSGGVGSASTATRGGGGSDSTIDVLVSFAGASGGGGGTAANQGAGGASTLMAEPSTNSYCTVGNVQNATNVGAVTVPSPACGGTGGQGLGGSAGLVNPTRASGSSPGGVGSGGGGGGGGEGGNGSGAAGGSTPATGDASAPGNNAAGQSCGGGGGGSSAEGAGGPGGTGGNGGSGDVRIFD